MEQKNGHFLFYQGNDGNVNVQVILGDETVWVTQKGMSEIFNVEAPAVNKHINNIYDEAELERDRTISKMEIVQIEGKREVKRAVDFYNLDMIIAVGYRVNSYQATQFRVWANKVLKEYLVKGFVMDDERLKQGKKLFDKDYFDELLERIREIRASERRFYQKITDIYALSSDYDKGSPVTRKFFASVQNRLEFAVTNNTAAEIIYSRADAAKPNMGLQTWKNAPAGKILKSDVTIAKNYLTEPELKELHRIVNMYLDYAELQATRREPVDMKGWATKLDAFLQFNEYEVLKDAGKVEKAVADAFAEQVFAAYRVVQDKQYLSDFDMELNLKLEEMIVKYYSKSEME